MIIVFLFFITVLLTIIHFIFRKLGLLSLLVSVINIVMILISLISARVLILLSSLYVFFGKSIPIIFSVYIAISVICLLVNLFGYMKDRRKF